MLYAYADHAAPRYAYTTLGMMPEYFCCRYADMLPLWHRVRRAHGYAPRHAAAAVTPPCAWRYALPIALLFSSHAAMFTRFCCGYGARRYAVGDGAADAAIADAGRHTLLRHALRL